MDRTLIIIALAAIALAAFGYFFVFAIANNNAQASQTLSSISIGGVVVAKVPSDVNIVYLNEAASTRVASLKASGSLFTFQACELGSEIGQDKNFRIAYEKSLQEVAEFLNSVVTVFTNYVKVNNKEFFKRVSNLLSTSITSGTITLAKYKHFEGVLGYNFCVITLYDPQTAMKAESVQNQLKSMAKELGIDWKEFKKKLEDAFKNAYSK